MYRLVFLNGRMKGRRVAVQQGSIMIGRDPQCHIDIAYDDEVSRNHAVIEQRPEGVYLKDLGSINKTEVNGKPVAGETKLNHGDQLEIGRTQIEFQNVEVVKAVTGRSVNSAQVFAVAAIACVILVQLAFVFVLPMWQNSDLQAAPPEMLVTNAVVATLTPDTQPSPAEAAATFTDAVAEVIAPAPESSTASAELVSAEVQQLRQALAELQKQVADLNQQTDAPVVEPVAPQPEPPVTAAVVAAAATPAEPEQAAAEDASTPVPLENRDAVQDKAKAMLADAKAEMAKNNFIAADDLIERIQVLSPDFTPAYVERARLYESRGMLKKAGEQWSKAMDLSIGTPLYEEAAAERQRLARTELIQTMTGSERDDEKDNAQRMPRRIRIVNVEREKFEGNQEFDEMRLVRVNVKPRMSEGEIDTGEFICSVVFYDRSQFKDAVRPTRAVAPKDALKVDGTWPAGEQKTVTAAYIVPKDFRAEEEKIVGEKRAYEGYRVLIYYKGVLQDETALPKSLLALPAPPIPDRTGK